MFEQLMKTLRTESSPPESMSLIHADSTDDGVGLANYDFLVHHYISYFLKHKYKVCLVSFAQSLAHHKVIQQKLGNNVVHAQTIKQLAFVDVMTHAQNITKTDGLSVILSAIGEALLTLRSDISPVSILSTPTLLVLHDLHTLTDIGFSAGHTLQLLCKIRSLHDKNYSTMLTSCARDQDGDLYNLCNQLSYWSDLTFHVDDLSTGLSKDVHGQLDVIWMPKNSVTKPKEEHYHYKTTDRDLRLFAVGASPAVL